MTSSQHIRSAFDRDLEMITSKMLKMGGLVESSIIDAAEAFENRDLELAQNVRKRDKKIDALEAEINEDITRIIALQAPAASDLRTLLSILKIAGNLERIGDYSKNIARRSQVIVTEEEFDRLPVNIIGLGTHVQELLHQVLDAYMELDIEKAMKIWESDVETDRLYLSIFKETLQAMTEHSDNVKMMTHLIFMSKNLERIGDYTTSIAKQTYFLIEGKVPETKRPKAMTTF